MGIEEILVLAVAAAVLRLVPVGRWRAWGSLAVSVLAIYWFQPLNLVRYLDFWLPTFTLFLVGICWIIITPAELRRAKVNFRTYFFLGTAILLIATTRFISLEGVVTASRPPSMITVLLAIALFGGGSAFLYRRQTLPARIIPATIFSILALFVVIKQPEVADTVGGWLRLAAGQPAKAVGRIDIRWLGFSYVAFRLIHTLRDYQSGRGIRTNLRDYMLYVIFFPTLAAGPIDRIERFLKDLNSSESIRSTDFAIGGKRIAIGLFKKYVIADSLALVALNSVNAAQVQSQGWSWILLYAYAFLIYFDFSGYTDIAIGIGSFVGIHLPENFNQPYLKSNLTQFWNNWHMTLTQWFRSYFFFPLTRKLSRSPWFPSPMVIIFITQATTMILIGLWHGITGNFILWGLWHGLGLFVHTRWADWTRPLKVWLESHLRIAYLYRMLSVALTFHYVMLGWIWFQLPSPEAGLYFLKVLLGFG